MNDVISRRTDAADIDHDPEPLRVTLEDPAAETLFATLSSEYGKRIVQALQDEPSPQARLAERVDTSLQNVQHHVSRLEAAGLVEVVTTDRSCKGSEMDVYGLAGAPLVVTITGADGPGDDTMVATTGRERTVPTIGDDRTDRRR